MVNFGKVGQYPTGLEQFAQAGLKQPQLQQPGQNFQPVNPLSQPFQGITFPPTNNLGTDNNINVTGNLDKPKLSHVGEQAPLMRGFGGFNEVTKNGLNFVA